MTIWPALLGFFVGVLLLVGGLLQLMDHSMEEVFADAPVSTVEALSLCAAGAGAALIIATALLSYFL